MHKYKTGEKIGSTDLIYIKKIPRTDLSLIRCHCGNKFKCEIHRILKGKRKTCGCAKVKKKIKATDNLSYIYNEILTNKFGSTFSIKKQ
jgi:hypothetical protein